MINPWNHRTSSTNRGSEHCSDRLTPFYEKTVSKALHPPSADKRVPETVERVSVEVTSFTTWFMVYHYIYIYTYYACMYIYIIMVCNTKSDRFTHIHNWPTMYNSSTMFGGWTTIYQLVWCETRAPDFSSIATARHLIHDIALQFDQGNETLLRDSHQYVVTINNCMG